MKRKEKRKTPPPTKITHGPPPLGRLPDAVLRRNGPPLLLALPPRLLGLPGALAGLVLGPLQRVPGKRRGARERAQAPHVGGVGRRRRGLLSRRRSSSDSSCSYRSLSSPSLALGVPPRDEEERAVDEDHRVRRPLAGGESLASEEERFLCCRRGFFPLPCRRSRCCCCCRRRGTDGAPRRARDRRRVEARVVVAGPRARPIGRDDERDDVVEEQARARLCALAGSSRRLLLRRRRRRSLRCRSRSRSAPFFSVLLLFLFCLTHAAKDQHAVPDARGAVRRPRASGGDATVERGGGRRGRGRGRAGSREGVREARPLSADRVEEAALGFRERERERMRERERERERER